MRLLVISDSHKMGSVVDRILSSESEAHEVFFLGDLVSDIEDLTYAYPEKNFHIVSGNCDFFSRYPTSDIVKLKDMNIFMCHGHNLGVKGSTSALAVAARKAGCKVALYGHTHSPYIQYDDGLYIVNPGSVAQSRNGPCSYAVIDVRSNGILPSIVKI